MQFIFSILSLIGIIGFVLWWSVRDMETMSPISEGNTVIAPIDQAKEVKQLIESKNLISLDLSEQGLTKVPAYVFERTDLQSLDLSNNNLTGALQGEIRFLRNLKTLDLSGNKFSGIPAEVGQLKNLETLDLSNNLLTGLPYELGNLSNLKILDVSGNHYSEADLEVIKKGLSASVTIKTE